jgi:hypothetical protein
MASKYRSPHLLVHRLHMHLQPSLMTALKCISKLTPSWPAMSHHASRRVCVYVHFITWWWTSGAQRQTAHHPHSIHKLDNIATEYMRKSGSGLRSVGRGCEDIKGYMAMMNYTNCMNLRTLGKSVWETTQFAWICQYSASVCETKNLPCMSLYFV